MATSSVSPAPVRNRPRVVNAWCSYDWANSVYNLVITSTIFPIYYASATEEAFGGNVVSFLGFSVRNTVLYSYAISFSFLVVVMLSPILSGVADYSGRKKQFMRFFTALGAIACSAMFFFTGENLVYGIGCAMLASVGYAGALVFYNAFLPEIVTPDRMDRVSARGFAMGYVGSVLLLLLNLGMVMQPAAFGLASAGQATRVAFLTVGVWWFGFAQIAFFYLRDRPRAVTRDMLGHGVRELRKALRGALGQKVFRRYLFAFFFYSMGVQTVMLMAPLFGKSEIGLEGSKLILTILILQIVAIGGAFLFARLANRFGNQASLLISLFIWMGICVGAYLLQTELQFYVLAGLVGLVMGGIQSVSRSTYAKLIPARTDDTASYFSLYDVTEKLAIVLGTASYGLIEDLTGTMRNSALGLLVFFVVGAVWLYAAPLRAVAPTKP